MPAISPSDYDPAMSPLMLATASLSLRANLSRVARRVGTVARDAGPDQTASPTRARAATVPATPRAR